jgi:hypothetical protein
LCTHVRVNSGSEVVETESTVQSGVMTADVVKLRDVLSDKAFQRGWVLSVVFASKSNRRILRGTTLRASSHSIY